MSENQVAQAVAAFARATVALPDAVLERGWPWRGHDEDVRLLLLDLPGGARWPRARRPGA